MLHVGLGLATALVLLGYGLVIEAASHHPQSGDFLKFYTSAQLLLEGDDIYSPVVSRTDVGPGTTSFDPDLESHPNLNPPFQSLLLAPLGHLAYRRAYVAWAVLSLLCGILGAAILGASWSTGGRRVSVALLMPLVLLLYFPTFMSVFSGQWSLVPFAGLVGGWMSWRSGRHAAGGAILGALAAIKLFFGAFLLLFAMRREWRAALWFAVSWLACTVFALVFTGWSALMRYVEILGDVSWYSASWNASFMGFFSRIFGGSEGASILELPWLSTVLHYGLSASVLALLFRLSRRSAARRGDTALDDLSFSFCIVFMLLASPFGWMYYFTFLFIPMTVVWRASAGLNRRGLFRWLLVLVWALSTTPHLIIRGPELEGDHFAVFGWAGAYFYALVLLGGLILAVHHDLRETAPRRGAAAT